MEKKYREPDYLFETSWEVCNKVGGIHTVISTKANNLKSKYSDKYILIGPDVWRDDGEHPEFAEDNRLFAKWKEKAQAEGLKIKIGRWKINSQPIAILVDFTPFFSRKDEIFAKFWESYKLDSLTGEWDYVEPTLFGYAAAKVIESFLRFAQVRTERALAQFHEWMTGAGVLYLKENVPQVATAFTTHATVLGRSLAGNNFPLYRNLNQYDPNQVARDFNLKSKQSLEYLAAHESDVFTTVSEITSKECTQFFKKDIDLVTPNGFEDEFVPPEGEFEGKRTQAREKLLHVTKSLLGHDIPDDTLFVANSGRYEFKNKGIDLFIDALGNLKQNKKLKRTLVAFILIPAGHYGPRKDLLQQMEGAHNTSDERILTHHLHDSRFDPIINRIRESGLENNTEDKVKVIFVPCYLDGRDGIFNMSYYDLLIGFDLTVFPSYYEPWGYTPLESLAFHIPTVTTTLAGFGLWVKDHFEDHEHGIKVLERTDDNDSDIVKGLEECMLFYRKLDDSEISEARKKAFAVSRIALWDNLVEYYHKAYDIALEKAIQRAGDFSYEAVTETIAPAPSPLPGMQPSWRRIFVESKLPKKLKGLIKLAGNLWWSWDDQACQLFESIDPRVWHESNHNPLVLFDSVDYNRFKQLEKDQDFISHLEEVLKRFDAYMAVKNSGENPKIAYFSMEYGLHDSIKIFSGGLGVLAGDYLKEASDSNVDLVGVGLLYRYGYFKQMISIYGEQHAVNDFQHFSRLPVKPVKDKEGNWITVTVALPGRNVSIRIWRLAIGRIHLYLLDTDLESNQPGDRVITHHLYGGDREMRLKQELLLGIAGIRALRTLGIRPDIYHSNEGHSAFIGIERIRRLVQDKKLTFQEAKEIIRSSTLFTTHTPVPAGHDSFPEDLLRTYIPHYADKLQISWDEFMGLGRYNPADHNSEFNMSVLAINLSMMVNGVSKLHGEVSRQMFASLYPGFLPEELHIGHITNGVHFATWTAPVLKELYRDTFPKGFEGEPEGFKNWEKIHEVPDAKLWTIKKQLKKELIDMLGQRTKDNWIKRHENPKYLIEVFEKLSENILTIGFARRFATYKRAHLIFRDLERLARIVSNPDRPVQFLFAGKAHPNDKAGQDLIKRIVEISKMPEFIGKVLFLQNYDMFLGSKLVQGVDIWLNTPTRPLEASGTSGQKAAMNGTMNLSVLDGWWVEGYREDAGWALPAERNYEDQDLQDELDAETIYQILENEIVPVYYDRDKSDVPVRWMKHIKNTIAGVAPHFTTARMINDYKNIYYKALYERTTEIRLDDFAMAKSLTQWKARFHRMWQNLEVVSFNIQKPNENGYEVGEKYNPEIEIDLNGLNAGDIQLELVIIEQTEEGKSSLIHSQTFELFKEESGRAWFRTKIVPTIAGSFNYGVRISPFHQNLPHKQDFPLIKWA